MKLKASADELGKVEEETERVSLELDFVEAQQVTPPHATPAPHPPRYPGQIMGMGSQKELEEILGQLEAKAAKAVGGASLSSAGDGQRELMLNLAVAVDAELKRAEGELEEVADIAKAATRRDAAPDPLHQITHILNRHIDTLHKLNEQTGTLSGLIDLVGMLIIWESSSQKDSARWREVPLECR